MKILVAGASGLLGQPLVAALTSAGHDVTRLVRDSSRPGVSSLVWNPTAGQVDRQAVADCDAVINLAGENIASGRWTAAQKQRILESRTSATATLAQALAETPGKARTWINASAVGYYGNRGDERLTEDSSPGLGDFLSEVCRRWEAATQAASQSGTRVILSRFGVVLSGQGGALRKMLMPFRLGIGGKIGNGAQFISWIALDDAIGALLHVLANPAINGPVNVVAPQPITNLEYTKTLGRVLHRPTVLPLPAFAARIALGQMADELLLASQRAEPQKLLATRYAFKYPALDGALRHVLS